MVSKFLGPFVTMIGSMLEKMIYYVVYGLFITKNQFNEFNYFIALSFISGLC